MEEENIMKLIECKKNSNNENKAVIYMTRDISSEKEITL